MTDKTISDLAAAIDDYNDWTMLLDNALFHRLPEPTAGVLRVAIEGHARESLKRLESATEKSKSMLTSSDINHRR